MRTASLAAFVACVVIGLWWVDHRIAFEKEETIRTAKSAAQEWSANQRPVSASQATPVVMPSAACRALNSDIVKSMHELYRLGYSPPFSTAPLLEVLRSGNCTTENPSVQVLLTWIAATKKAQATHHNSAH